MDGLGPGGFVGQREVVKLTVLPHGDEEGHFRAQAVLGAVKGGVAHAVAALVAVEGGFGGQEAGVPAFLSRFLNIIEAAAVVPGDSVVAVAQKPLELRIPVEAVAAPGVGDHAQEILASQVVDPGQGRGRGGNHILPAGILEVAKLHTVSSYVNSLTIKLR